MLTHIIIHLIYKNTVREMILMDIEQILKELTLEEKAALCMGADVWCTLEIKRLNLPSVRTADGPHGLRKQFQAEENNVSVNRSTPATCFPPAALASCSFNRKLVYEMGQAIADEAILQDVDIVLGPAVNIKRSPLCGRNFEYVSEDPYLAGEYAVSFINGAQSRGVGTSLKHFAVNNQERLRMNIDALVDERALREIYLYPFERAVRNAKPYTVMGSYNRINGDYGCENSHTIKELLRGEWGFDGLVMSDWSAINNRVKGLKAGCDLEMPNSGKQRTQEIIDAVKKGEMNESVMDDAVRNVLRLVDRCKKAAKVRKENIYDAHNELALKIAAESMVLLKNENNMLPLKKEGTFALIGAFAGTPRYQGGGSSHIVPTRLVSMNEICQKARLKFTYSQGYNINSELIDEKLISEAARNAKNADTAIVFIGLTDLNEYEGLDRKDMAILPSHIMLLDEVYKANKNVVVVLCAGSAVDMEWETKCRAILYAGVMGQAGSQAIYDILFGSVNPSGKLSETFPMKLADTPCFNNFPGGNNSVRYMESIFIGYRYYSTAKVPVRYPFGFGLSYTTFDYLSMGADTDRVDENRSLNIKVKVKNTGKADGAEVVQIYIRNNSGNTFTPDIILKNYDKLYLKVGETKEAVFKINYEDFMRYDPSCGWVADPGDYQIFAAGSSKELRKDIHVRVAGSGEKQSCEGLSNYFNLKGNSFDENQFKKLYGRELAPLNISYEPIGMNTPLEFCSKTLTGKALFKIGKWTIEKSNRGEDAYAARKALTDSLGDNPIRSMVVMNEGTNLKTGEGIVKMMNGHFFSGLKEVLKSLKEQED
jgi:Beta-glucosidase-related glycosidases